MRAPIDFPQVQGRPGGSGPPGAPGVAGAPGPAGAAGVPGAVDIIQIDLSEAELTAMAVTPVSVTGDAPGFIQLPVWWFIEISKTVAGAANPSMRLRWRGTATIAGPDSTVGLTTAEISWRSLVAAALVNNTAGAPNVAIPIEGAGLEVLWASAPGAVFRATGRISVAVVLIPAVFT